MYSLSNKEKKIHEVTFLGDCNVILVKYNVYRICRYVTTNYME